MEKDYVERIREMEPEQLLQLRIYLDAIIRDLDASREGRCTPGPSSAPLAEDDHNPR